MDVVDWTGCYKGNKNCINLNPLAPQWAFRLLIVGPSGSGKTNMMVDLIMKHIYYDKIYVLAQDIEEDLYTFLKDFFTACSKSDKIESPPEFMFSNSLADLPSVDEIAEDDDEDNIQKLVIFDDFITERHQEKIEDYFVRGRKKNCSMIYLAQSYFEVPKQIRKNCDYYALFNLSEKNELSNIAKSHSSRIPYKAFMKLYQEIMTEPYSFMLIDKFTPHIVLHIRKKWDGLMSRKDIQNL